MLNAESEFEGIAHALKTASDELESIRAEAAKISDTFEANGWNMDGVSSGNDKLNRCSEQLTHVADLVSRAVLVRDVYFANQHVGNKSTIVD